MKTKVILIALALLASLPAAFSQISIPSDGSDGAFNPSANVQIDLSQAVQGVWSANNSANAGKGIYDPDKWAIVFKFTSVNIPAGVTVTFKNHLSHAPVVWLVQGSATISGTVNLDGRGYVTTNINPEPGPGGFRGGVPGYVGLGIGAGLAVPTNGSYALSYGNPMIVPLIGGSGASGGGNGVWGGGVAILIAASKTINI